MEAATKDSVIVVVVDLGSKGRRRRIISLGGEVTMSRTSTGDLEVGGEVYVERSSGGRSRR